MPDESKASETAVRDPELATKVWTEEEDGAWAESKAPLVLLTTFMSNIQDENRDEALSVANKILEIEPNNRLVQDLVEAIQQYAILDDASESEEEEESMSDSESSQSTGSDDGDDAKEAK